MHMKRVLSILLVISALLALSGCGSFKVYQMNDILPPLVDITTQYPYTEKITVTECSSGKSLEFTEGADHDMIRMRFEGIQAIREKPKSDDPAPLFDIVFTTTDSTVAISVLSEYAFLYDGYKYEILRSGIDLIYFENLFTE